MGNPRSDILGPVGARVRIGSEIEIRLSSHPRMTPRTGLVTRIEDGQAYVTNFEDPGTEQIFGTWVNVSSVDGLDPKDPYIATLLG